MVILRRAGTRAYAYAIVCMTWRARINMHLLYNAKLSWFTNIKFIPASGLLTLYRVGHHVLSIMKKLCTSIMWDPPKDPADNGRVFCVLYAGKQGFRTGRGQPAAAQVTRYQKLKTPLICPTIFLVKSTILFSFFNYFILFRYSRQERGRDAPTLGLRPCSINSEKIQYEIMTSICRR